MSKENEIKIRVIYADTDAMGIVYHTNYIKWFEIGRTELLRGMGIVYATLEKNGYFLPLTELTCHYLAPAKYDEIISVRTNIDYFRRASIKFEYRILDDTGKTTLVEGSSVHAFVNKYGKIVRAPSDFIEAIHNWKENVGG